MGRFIIILGMSNWSPNMVLYCDRRPMKHYTTRLDHSCENMHLSFSRRWKNWRCRKDSFVIWSNLRSSECTVILYICTCTYYNVPRHKRSAEAIYNPTSLQLNSPLLVLLSAVQIVKQTAWAFNATTYTTQRIMEDTGARGDLNVLHIDETVYEEMQSP